MNDEFIYNNFTPEYDHFEGIGEVCVGFTNEDLRTAYDMGAADRLEQVIKWLNRQEEYPGTLYYETPGDIETIEDALRAALLPQEES